MNRRIVWPAVVVGMVCVWANPPGASGSPEGEGSPAPAPTQSRVKPARQERPMAPAKAAIRIPYHPPSVGVPGMRQGGSVRGKGQRFILSVVAPDHMGLTLRSQPVFYWFVNKPLTAPILFTLNDRERVTPLVETVLKPPFEAGIQSVRVEEFGVRLEPGRPYEWYVSMGVDADHPSGDTLAGGVVLRVDPPDGLKDDVARAEPLEAVRLLAERGYWYDAVTVLSDRIAGAPEDVQLRATRASLLQQVGLAEIADYDVTVGPRR